MFCVFFFKQKTAYEMRISDWSSDVCSSDLRSLIEAGTEITAQGIKNKLTGKRERIRSLFAVFEDHNRQVAVLVGKEYTKGTLQRYEKIGRASCRERVCQYV